jgi:hypothetical protein
VTETTEEMLARVRASFDRQGMMSTLGVEVTSVEPGKVEMSLRHDDRFTQQHGFLHAGAGGPHPGRLPRRGVRRRRPAAVRGHAGHDDRRLRQVRHQRLTAGER